jgi:CheY-like chemotaxis protein
MTGSPAETPSQVDRILVVDDLPDNYVLLQTFLESEAYEVAVAESGRAALDKIAANPPDLVLLDVIMPGMNGFEVAQRIRQNPALPFIPITASLPQTNSALGAALLLEPLALLRCDPLLRRSSSLAPSNKYSYHQDC